MVVCLAILTNIDYKSAPSISTLNTLALFAGYINWRDFKNQINIKQSSWFKRKIGPNMGIVMLSAAIMTLVFISFYSMIGDNNNLNTLDISKIKFESKSVTKGLPNTVIFDFDLGEINSDSLLIQQYWDKTKTIKIHQDQTQATGQYYYPGYFRAKLLVDGNIIKEHDLFIETQGWLGTLDYQPIPKYISENELMNGNLSFSKAILNEIKNNSTPLVSTFHKIEKFKELSGDNFELNTRLRNIYRDKWAVCQKVRIAIIGTKSALLIPFSIPGCVSDLGVKLSDTYINGKEHDLSSLGIDLSTFKNIKIKVIDKNITVFVDGKALFSNKFSKSIGNIVGLRFQFLGAGDISEVSIKGLSGTETILDQHFTLNK